MRPRRKVKLHHKTYTFTMNTLKRDCKHAIESLYSTGDEQHQGGANPCTNGGQNHLVERGPRKDPQKEEEAGATIDVEHGVATLLAMDSTDRTSSLLGRRLSKQKLQKLLKVLNRTRSRRPSLVYLLAATAGQVEKSRKKATRGTKVALEEKGYGRSSKHPLLISLATTTGRKKKSQ
jgi:hypothetical protein